MNPKTIRRTSIQQQAKIFSSIESAQTFGGSCGVAQVDPNFFYEIKQAYDRYAPATLIQIAPNKYKVQIMANYGYTITVKI